MTIYFARLGAILFAFSISSIATTAFAATNYLNATTWNANPALNANGNDSIPDDVAIQAAIDSLPSTGGVIYLPRGSYLIEQPLILRSGITLLGDGSGVAGTNPAITTLKPYSALSVHSPDYAPLAALITAPDNQQNSRLAIMSLTLNGRAAAGYMVNWAADLPNLVGSRIDNVHIQNFRGPGAYTGSHYDSKGLPTIGGVWLRAKGEGTGIFEAWNNRISDVQVSDTYGAGLLVGISDSFFSSIYVTAGVSGTRGDGIIDYYSFANMYTNCHVNSSEKAGLTIKLPEYLTSANSITNSYFDLNDEYGIEIDGSMSYGGIALTDHTSFATISNSQFRANVLGDVFLNNVQNVSLHGNSFFTRIYDNAIHIDIDGATDSIAIVGNQFSRDADGQSEPDDAIRQTAFTKSNIVFAGNVGLITSEKGATQIAAGATTATVSPALDGPVSRVYVTPTSDLGGRSFWVDNKTSTTFTVRLSSSASTPISFDWWALTNGANN